MRLLVSVRSAAEAGPALLGGADIIDAKDPARGSLGAVSPEALAAIVRRVPSEAELSLALGDLTCMEQAAQIITRLPAFARQSTTYVKLGFAGVPSPERVGSLLEAALALAREHPLQPRVIAVAYADAGQAESADPESMARVAARSGVAGFLVDTYRKDGRNLLAWMEPRRISALLARGRNAGLITAVAGSLQAEDLPALTLAGPDIVGFRGAACTGGREGRVSQTRVRQLRRAVDQANSEFLQEAFLLLPG